MNSSVDTRIVPQDPPVRDVTEIVILTRIVWAKLSALTVITTNPSRDALGWDSTKRIIVTYHPHRHHPHPPRWHSSICVVLIGPVGCVREIVKRTTIVNQGWAASCGPVQNPYPGVSDRDFGVSIIVTHSMATRVLSQHPSQHSNQHLFPLQNPHRSQHHFRQQIPPQDCPPNPPPVDPQPAPQRLPPKAPHSHPQGLPHPFRPTRPQQLHRHSHHSSTMAFATAMPPVDSAKDGVSMITTAMANSLVFPVP
mmetsp:Transcript_31662/g.44958  ORF Transcript_31662/g.44958 Transcript_31662/m.44958 type:complete len:252 (+) Transcript_31662:474-1229(+)